jgi:hypothetical protein
MSRAETPAQIRCLDHLHDRLLGTPRGSGSQSAATGAQDT